MIETVVRIDGMAVTIDLQPNLVALVYRTKQQARGEDPTDRRFSPEDSPEDTDSQDGSHDESHSSEDDTCVQGKKKSSRSGLFKKLKKKKMKKRSTNKKKESKLGSLLTSAKKISMSLEPSKIIKAKLEHRFVKKRYLIDVEDSSGSLCAGRLGSQHGELEELPTIYETTELKEPTPTKTSPDAAGRKERKLTKRWNRFKRVLSIQKQRKMRHDDAGSGRSCNDTASSTSTTSPTRSTSKKQQQKPQDLDGAGTALVRDDAGTAANPASTTGAIVRSSAPSKFEGASPPPPRPNRLRPPPPLPPAIALRGDFLLPDHPRQVAEEEPSSAEDPSSNAVVSPVPSPPGSPRKKILRYKKKKKKSCKKVDDHLEREETQAGAAEKPAAIAVPSRPSRKEGSTHSLLRLVAAFLGALIVWQASRCELPREPERDIAGPVVNQDDWAGGASDVFSTGGVVEMVANLEWPHDQSWSEAPLEMISSYIIRL